MLLEQCLPFTVLKLRSRNSFSPSSVSVGTVLTVYGIETLQKLIHRYLLYTELEQCLPFTVLKQMELTTKVPVEHGWNSAYRLRY